MSASIKFEDRVKDLLTEIMKNAEPEPASTCCIYRVPKLIRSVNKKAYTPQLVSIGPFHHGKEKLAEMEKQKGRYVKSVFDRLAPCKYDEIVTFVQKKELLIRDSYAETFKLESPEFVRMIICDAIFVIEHFLRTFSCRSGVGPWPYVPAVQNALSLDLQLLENQLPYFVLKGISDLVLENVTFKEICNRFFKGAYDLEFHDEPVVKHFTDAIRTAQVKSYPEVEAKGSIKGLPCALELHESGVKFKNNTEGLFDIRFQKRKRLVPCLKVPELHLPCFTIYDTTECLLRNVMALEQCHYPSDTKVCNYVRLMDLLINTEKDVELLVAEEVISNRLGDNAEVACMVNKLSTHIVLDEYSSYYECCEELKTHCKSRWNKTKAMLRRVYFSNLWTGTATVAAVVLLILTAIQTICSIIQV